MTDILSAAERFSKECGNVETKIPRRFFAEFKSNVKAIAADVRFRERSGEDEIYGENGLWHGAKCSLAALRSEEKMSVCGDEPYSFALAKAYLSAAGDGINGETLRLFVVQISKTHDFKIAELLLLRDFFTAALADLFVRGDVDEKSRCARAFVGLDAFGLDDIFMKFTKVHNILALEKAGAYEKCSRDTVLHYDMTLLEMCGGADEIKAARHILFRADAAGEHVGKYLLRRGGDAGRAYLWLTFVLTACVFAIVASVSNALISLFALVPSYMLAKEISRAVFERSSFFLPSLSIDKATDDERCVVAITTLLCGERSDKEIFDNIEDFYLQNNDDAFTFAVLGDLRESDRKHAPSDDAVIKYASSRINALRKKYGAHFALFIRRRRFAVCERKYLGWERKRGAVLELCRYISGGDGSFDTIVGGERVCGSRFLLTLDSDTKLGISSVREMLGTMLHPQNRPVVDKERGRVVGGYAILQPKMAVSLFSANNSRFAALTGGGGGTDRYSAFSFDLYQDVFGRGIYCGKGMIDVEAFLAVCDGTFPKERILSHDLLEGAIARAAVSGKTVLTDGTPRTATAYFSRLERWIRGDLQTLSYMWGSVKNEAGKKIVNPVDPLARYQIFDNIVRESAPLFCVLLVLACSFFRSYYALFLLAYLLVPLIKSVLWIIFGRERKTVGSALASLSRAAAGAAFEICSLAAYAGTFIKAVVNVIYSAAFTKRGFLAWTTAAELESKKRGGIFGHLFELKGSVIFGAIAMTLPLPALAAGALWALFPVAAWALGKGCDTVERISPAAKEKMRIYSADMWKFFSDNVGEATNWLPPDNVRLSPSSAVAMRTSPTNIGLYFLATLAARDFEFIGTDELLLRASNALDSLEKMLRWNGHLYNWYDLATLNVTGVPFVSSVDSGNFTTALVAFCEGIKEYASENVNLIDVKNRAEKFIRGADFSKLIDKGRGFLSVGYNASSGLLAGSCYDMLMSEARTTAYFAEGTHAVPQGYYRRLGRTLLSRGVKTGAASWSGTTFEFFMPSLLLPEPKNSFPDAALSYAFARQVGGAVRVSSGGCKVFGVSESCFFEFDHEMNYQYGAFGIAPLSLDPRVRSEKVVSPYSSFLMFKRAPSRVLSNLEKLKSIGMYGKYGFYEALDTEKSRVGNGYAVIKSFMSHHIGMSIVAAANAVFGDIFVDRFMRDPLMRSSRELLGERTPSGGGTARKRAKIRSPKTEIPPARQKTEKKEKLPPTLVSPTCVMLSNNKTRVVLSSSGQIAFFDGSDLMAAAPFEKFSLGGGLSVCAFIDGSYISAVPLGYVSDGVSSNFSFAYADGKATYRSVHEKGGKRVGFDMTVSLAEDAEILTLSCKFTGDVSDGVASVYFEPVIDDRKAYLSHKSFSNLFIESKFFADENALVFRRRPRSDGRSSKYLGIVSSPPFAHGDFDTRRDAVLPQNYDEEDIARLCGAGKGKNQAGADIIPACSVRVRIGAKSKTVSFMIGYSHNCDDLLYILSRGEETRGGKIYDLQRAASGADDRVAELERLVLGKIMFGSRENRASGFGIFAALSKKPVYQKNLWRHGISGDRDIVCATVASGSEAETARLDELLRLFKYSCIRGLRYDFVVMYSESDAYNAPVEKKIRSAVGAVGLGGFVGCDGGIFLLDSAACTDGEKAVLRECSAQYFDLSVPNDFSAADRYYVDIPASVAARLKKDAIKKISDAALPDKYGKGTDVGRGILHDDSFTIVKNGIAPPWAHVIASRGFGTVVSENSLGFTFFSNSVLGKLTPHTADNMTEDGGEKLILRVYKSGDGSDYDDFDAAACAKYAHFGDGIAEYTGAAAGIGYTVFVDVCERFPAKRVKVALRSDRRVRVDVIYAAKTAGGVPLKSVAVSADEVRGAVFFSPVYVASRRAVRGLVALCGGNPNIYTDEAALRTAGKIFGGGDICAVCDAVKDETEHSSTFILAAVRTDEAEKYIFGELIPHIEDVPRSVLCAVTPRVRTPVTGTDASVNFWLPYQTVCSRLFARAGFYQVGGAYGFRDQLQDVISLIPYAPQLAREHLLRAASHQYTDGSVMHWWHNFGYPHAGIRSRCSDDSVWLAYALSEYVEKTGDADILAIDTPYLDSPPLDAAEHERYETAPFSEKRDAVIVHALRGLERSFRVGAHGLPLIGGGDWNDGMNNVGRRGRGESVWLAFFSSITAKKLAAVCLDAGLRADAERLEKAASRLISSASKTFDGSWYLRGYYDDGTPLGKKGDAECEVDIMPQAFAAAAAYCVDPSLYENAKAALQNASKVLFDEKSGVFRLLCPPFDKGDSSPGYIKGYLPGIRENGGQYTHAAVFAALGMLLIGMNKEGAELLFRINPLVDRNASYKIEPYVLAGDVYAEKTNVGRGGWSWYTGAAGWYRTVFIEELCGYRQTPRGFSVSPRFSEAFDSFTLEVRRGDTLYVIKASLSERDFTVLDGREWKNEFLFDGGVHNAEIFRTRRGFEPSVHSEDVDFSDIL